MPDIKAIKTLGDLRAATAHLPDDTRVMVDGYEGDFDDMIPCWVWANEDAGTSHYCGDHTDLSTFAEEGHDFGAGPPHGWSTGAAWSPVRALVLSRGPAEDVVEPLTGGSDA